MKSHHQALLLPLLLINLPFTTSSCPNYSQHAETRHQPFSPGKYSLSYARPPPSCRTFNSSVIESLLTNLSSVISDPDLFRLFENTFPNTLDTAIRWHGLSSSEGEELTFIITGDINALWLRDSANQLQSYLSLLTPSSSLDSLASLFRGVINLQARYLTQYPYCNSFQPPPESGIPPSPNPAASSDHVFPAYDHDKVFECKYELDSLASFLQVSSQYYETTHDIFFFVRQKEKWVAAISAVLSTAKSVRDNPTYDPVTGKVLPSPYSFTRQTSRSSETLLNDGLGSPVAAGTGLIRSSFRPSDDAHLFQFLIPSNMLFCRCLSSVSLILSALNETALAEEASSFSSALRQAITKHGIVPVFTVSNSSSPDGTKNGDGQEEREIETIYAYETDGYGSIALMDDANIPSLLSSPLFGYLAATDPVYQRTRKRLLSQITNPYFMKGSVLNAIGGPHVGPGRGWPMASIVRIMTSDDDEEIRGEIKQLLGSTDGLGLMHESVDANNEKEWTRGWFSWANGLFGQMILDLRFRKPEILKESFQ
ncbi:hypothetical protein QBC35DRAFT_413684 [Podospora australis]|uniref:Glycoside hydrolase family 125 protein n=1 Tax=Podospora australis TaxID=1536484 RepID=A0AAN6WRA6_9PEZI|nr:hypothetical protein QBC35DRAFT_413684 [Podospora australis]